MNMESGQSTGLQREGYSGFLKSLSASGAVLEEPKAMTTFFRGLVAKAMGASMREVPLRALPGKDGKCQ